MQTVNPYLCVGLDSELQLEAACSAPQGAREDYLCEKLIRAGMQHGKVCVCVCMCTGGRGWVGGLISWAEER